MVNWDGMLINGRVLEGTKSEAFEKFRTSGKIISLETQMALEDVLLC